MTTKKTLGDLTKDFPQIYGDCFHFEGIADGWADLLYDLSAKLVEILGPDFTPEDFEPAQIKEKFGGLRYYVDIGIDVDEKIWRAIQDAIDEAEERSFEICIFCGEPGEVQKNRGWLRPICEEHHDET